MRRYTDRLHLVAGRVTGPCPVPAGRRERRRPAEAAPLGQLRVWTTLFGQFTVAAWKRQAPPRGAPSGSVPPRWTRRTWAIHPAALSRLGRGVASRDQPQGNPLGSRRWTRLSPGVGHGSLPCAATAQQTKQESVAGAPPSFGSAWGPTRWFSGRPSPRLGPRVAGSFTLAQGSHVNRTGGWPAGADWPACLDLGIEAAPGATAAAIPVPGSAHPPPCRLDADAQPFLLVQPRDPLGVARPALRSHAARLWLREGLTSFGAPPPAPLFCRGSDRPPASSAVGSPLPVA